MDYQPVKEGDDLKIPPQVWNALLSQLGRVPVSSKKGQLQPSDDSAGCWIRVQNVSGSGVGQFHIMTMKEPTVKPPDDPNDTGGTENQFKNRIYVNADTPSDKEEGRWCVLQEPLADKAFGWAIIVGLTVCWINLAATADAYVESDSGKTVPLSGASGSAQIVWVKGGVGKATKTGEQWALIKIGGGSSSLPVGQYQGILLQMVTDNQIGYDFLCSHAME